MERTMDEITEQNGRPTVSVGTQTVRGEGSGKDIVKDETVRREGLGEDTVKDEISALQGRLTVTVNTKSNKRLIRFFGQSDQLLPGIPDDITLNQIVPKMQWRVFHVLSSVSHRWRQAIQSHQVHDARVRSNVKDTFLVIDGIDQIALYSLRDKYSYKLPAVQQLGGRKWAALDGRLYAIGGEDPNKFCGYRVVNVLDLAGQREWKECASMEDGRCDFGCGVMEGKIYVFGGKDGRRLVCGSEVYDPKDDSWSRICPAPGLRCEHDVAALGEELFLLNGKDSAEGDVHWEVYHTVKDEWRIVRPSLEEKSWGDVFMLKGKFYSMIEADLDVYIDVYDYENKTWSQLHSSSFAGIPGMNHQSEIYGLIAVDDKLFVAVHNDEPEGYLLLRSNGLGSDEKEVSWEIDKGSPDLDYYFLQCTIEL